MWNKLEEIPILKKGGIHIKKKNRGKFTEYCGGKVTEECIRKGKNSSSSTIRKRATFAANARKWKHENGGVLKYQNPSGPLFSVQPGSPVTKALEVAKTLPKQTHQGREIIGPDGQKHFIRTEAPIQPATSEVMSFVPGVGDAMEVAQIGNDVRNGNYGTATLAAGLMVLPGNLRKLLDSLTPVKSDKFIDFFSKAIGKPVKRVSVTKNDFGGVYSNGFRYLDESGKEIAHIAGSKHGNRVFVESSFMDPEFRSRGIGKQMYFDFNDQMFDKYGTTIGSNSGQHMMTMELPGSSIRISPSGKLWRGLRKEGLATTERPPIVDYIMAEPKIIKSYKKYLEGGKL